MTLWLTMLVWTAPAADPAETPWQVGTLTETRRVLREEQPPQQREVQLGAARNEWESFQILVRSDVPVGGLIVKPGDLHGPDDARIGAADARLYRQHPMELTIGTHRNDQFQPGWYPDALIPFKHPLTGEALPDDAPRKAVPFDLPPGQTHGFWVDIHVPHGAPAGQYRGTYRVESGDGRAVEVPVSLDVWDFALPDVPTMQTALGSPAQRMRDHYRTRAKQGKEPEPADWEAVETQCAEMLARHRINATPPLGSFQPALQDDGSFEVPADQVARFRDFVDRCHINAYPVTHPRRVVSDPVEQNERLRAWLAAWDRAAAALDRPHVVLYTYLLDEPNDEEAYRYVQHWGRAIREANSVIKVLVVEQTWTQNEAWGDLHGAVDIWCPLFSLFRQESAAKRQALGETIWTYTALCQREPTPWWHIDFPLLNYRVPSWISWRYRIRGLLYWGGMSFWRQVEDPWTDPKTLDRRKDGRGPLFNGEGTLVYPGRACGYDGIAPSLRLKALRDGIEDYEYLAILERQGRAAEAEEIILPLAGSWFEWERDAAAYQAARRRLAERIVAGKP